MAPCAQFFMHTPQPRRTLLSTSGLPAQCMSIFPAREPQPMPIFLMAPPKPVLSCPFEVGQRNEYIRIHHGAADMGPSRMYSPPRTGTSTSSVPFRPSGNNDLAVGKMAKTRFAAAASIWSSAFYGAPHSVSPSVKRAARLQLFHGVRNGLCKIGPAGKKRLSSGSP